jgi:hypothetical protein
MSDTVFIIGEIIAGIAIIGVGSAIVTVIVARLLPKPTRDAEVLRERYARGDLTREQYVQICQDLGIAPTGGLAPAERADSRQPVGAGDGSRR